MELPESFKQTMKSLLGDDYARFMQTYNEKSVSSIRVNTSKISVREFEKIAPYPVKAIPFVSNGYYINDTDAWSKHPYYYAGLYYIQEASALLPASRLPVNPGDIVLDLCAAPGGKSTQLSVSDAAVLISNDISRSRTIPLVKNLALFGRKNYCVTCEDPKKLAAIHKETFDKILVDAPCSGEGMFRKDKGLIESYFSKGPEYYSVLQKEILEYAYTMTVPGGMIMYSTCTFSDTEDEQVILSFITAHPDVKVCDIKKESGLCGPYDRYKKNPDLNGCVHAFPHALKGEGHFMALLKKSGRRKEADHVVAPTDDFDHIKALLGDIVHFFSEGFIKELEEKRYLKSNDGSIYMLPDGFDSLYNKSIRYARTGIHIGQISKNGRFIPNTALALVLKPDDFQNKLMLTADDTDVAKYLKGETLVPYGKEYNALIKGVVLVCADGFPLGFASYDGTKLKNLYEKGWIYR